MPSGFSDEMSKFCIVSRSLIFFPKFQLLEKYIFKFDFSYRRVHITKATLLELGDKFEVEDGKGSERDDILAKLNLETFLIIPPKQQVRKIDVCHNELKTRKKVRVISNVKDKKSIFF